jgi:hypothetical protein
MSTVSRVFWGKVSNPELAGIIEREFARKQRAA